MTAPTPRSDARRRALAEAALRVLGREGYARLTARKVAAEAGLSLGHITYNFASMDEVLSEAYRHASADLREATEAALARSGDPMARVSAFLRAGFAEPFLAPAHIRMRVDLWSAALSHPDLAATERDLYDRYRAALLGLLADLGGPVEKVEAVADTVMATLDGLWLDWARRQNPAALERGLATCEDLIRLSLVPKGSA
jgi:AcrR family transcriptional regulator